MERKKLQAAVEDESGGGSYFAKPSKKTFGSGCELLNCVLGGGWGKNRIANIVGDKCLSGDSIVSVYRGGDKPKKMTIRTLYNRVNGKHPNRNAEAVTEVLADLGGYAGRLQLVSVQQTGNKMLYQVTTNDGGSIHVSRDHKFKTDVGWKTIATGLAVGSLVYCWRGKQTGRESTPRRDVTYCVPFHPNGWQHVVAGKNYKRMLTARLLIEAGMNGLELVELVRILRNDPERASQLAFSDSSLEVHHKDGDPLNDSLDNLELITSPDHSCRHSDDMRRDTNRLVLCRIKSITSLSVQPTYDLTMVSPHNFIADGFVVHNSTGKTLLAIEEVANFLRRYKQKAKVRYREIEAAFDPEYAEALGLDTQRVDFGGDRECYTVEDVFGDMEDFVESIKDGEHGLYVLDSLDALSDRAEMENGFGEATFGVQKAKDMSKLFRKLNQKLSRGRVTVAIISQIRDKIGVTFGKKTTRAGGKALDFYASQVIYLSHIAQIKKTIGKVERKVGVTIKAHCEKNKIGLPFRECTFNIRFGFGIDDMEAAVNWLQEVEQWEVWSKVALEIAPASPAGNPEKFLKYLRQCGEEEFRALRKAMNSTVKQTWFEIESRFLPKRAKYGHDD